MPFVLAVRPFELKYKLAITVRSLTQGFASRRNKMAKTCVRVMLVAGVQGVAV